MTLRIWGRKCFIGHFWVCHQSSVSWLLFDACCQIVEKQGINPRMASLMYLWQQIKLSLGKALCSSKMVETTSMHVAALGVSSRAGSSWNSSGVSLVKRYRWVLYRHTDVLYVKPWRKVFQMNKDEVLKTVLAIFFLKRKKQGGGRSMAESQAGPTSSL